MRQIGSIHCLENIRFHKTDGQGPWIILFHGFGADAYDLQPLGDILAPQKSCAFLFPQGVLEVPIGPGWTGRAWWKLDMKKLEESIATGEGKNYEGETPEGLPALRQKILSAIDQMRVPWDQIILGGFSQGAMLATDIYLHAPQTPKGLMILSGALINKEEWKRLAPQRSGKSFFMCHGKSDAILAFKGAQSLETLLTQSGMKGRLMSFSGGHEIPPQVILEANKYLDTILE